MRRLHIVVSIFALFACAKGTAAEQAEEIATDGGTTPVDAGRGDAASGDASTDADGAPGCDPGMGLVCGRAAGGVTCAASTGSSYQALGAWQTMLFNDATSWGTSPAYFSTLQYPDVDGDGKDDVCARGAPGVVCARSTGTTFDGFAVWQAAFADSEGWNSNAAYYGTIQFPDVNGDGKADVCGRGVGGVACAPSTGTSFGPIGAWQTSLFGDALGWAASPAAYATVQFPDVNGDGKADVCGRATGGILCALSSGTSFGVTTEWIADYSDGRGWAVGPAYYATIQFPDVNGDGKADVCGRGIAGVLCSISSGSAFGAIAAWTLDAFSDAAGWNAGPAYYATIQFPDVNGDGKADVCGRGVNGVACALSSGTGFGGATVWSSELSDAQGWSADRAYYGTIQFPDVNGDGKADVCGRGPQGIGCAISSGTSFGPFTPTSAALSDANGWKAAASASTIRFPRVARGDCRPSRAATPLPSPAMRFGL